MYFRKSHRHDAAQHHEAWKKLKQTVDFCLNRAYNKKGSTRDTLTRVQPQSGGSRQFLKNFLR